MLQTNKQTDNVETDGLEHLTHADIGRSEWAITVILLKVIEIRLANSALNVYQHRHRDTTFVSAV